MLNQLTPLGHNNPPSDIEILQERLTENNKDAFDRTNKLLADAEQLPDACYDESAEQFTETIKRLMACDKFLNAQREKEKEPFLAGGRAVDGFFNVWREKVSNAKTKLSRVLTVYQQQKANEERAAREAQAKLLREKAEREIAEARRLEEAKATELATSRLEQAVITEQQAQKVEASAQVKPAELHRSRGSQGQVASLRTVWKGEIVNRKELDIESIRDHIPLDALERALSSFVRAGGRELRGAKIYSHEESVVR